MAQYDLFLLNAAKEPIAQVDQYKRVEIIRRMNNTGSWLMELEVDAVDLADLIWLGGVRVLRNGVNYFEGIYQAMEDENLEAPDGSITLSGLDYMWYLEKRLVLPVPAGPPYTSSAYDTRSGAAGDVIKRYVRNHVTSLAKAERIAPGLTVDSDLGDGGTVTGYGRFQTVLEMAQVKALEGGDIGFRFSGTDFQTFTPVDRSAEVKFSATHGTLRRYRRKVERPKSNYIIAGGTGEGTARAFHESGNQDSINLYGRSEWFYDYRSASGLQLTTGTEGKLMELAEKVTIECEVGDTVGVQFIRDYDLGDIVMVIVPNLTYTNVIRELKLTLDGSGEHVYPVIGTPGATELNALNKMFTSSKEVVNRVSLMERI